MGFSIAWIAVQTENHDSIFELLDVNPTSEEDEYFESKLSGSALKNGWFLLVGQGFENRLVQNDVLSELSEFGPTVACSIEEHVMYSSAEYWSSGSKKWTAVHDAQKGRYNLETSGSLPISFESLNARVTKEQDAEGGEKADVDLIFDIPLLLASELTGFKHDEDCESLAQPNPVVFSEKGVATTATTVKRPWWKLW
ncbi:hypothetical protein WNY63_21455 [Pseudoalteromonas neustonica]|uniref:Uncharacterized protein n=1 Tax=Pseudoalteromonas neustonica TaxID=1840331 RepID=A0ABU9U8B6_9GAMM